MSPTARRILDGFMIALVLLMVLAAALYFIPAAFAQSSDATTATTVKIPCSTTVAVVRAANAKIRSWLVQAPSANTVTVYVSFASTMVADTTSIQLDAGAKLSDQTYPGAVYCRTASGTSDLTYAETSR